MAGGGSKPGERRGGRKKGTPNKKTSDLAEKLKALNCDPIEGMARIAHEAYKAKDHAIALSAYKELAQYIYPKRKAVEVTGEDGGPLEIKGIEVVGISSATDS